ncbi:GNAT family N-acetyltransferase [Blastomonas sp. AAP53]|uniref:GNAT family N-acetyltransferase n=1 Tax=Blastomonas sp. AAP53 TaxID=1248760 RepID=UPI0002EB4A03|nr:GNAT family N-acetyltransferase [Blastomonas sp. AAP53]
MNAPTAPIRIEHERSAHGGRFVYQAQGAEAELTYARAPASGDTLRVSADHTYVPDSMRGQGIAAQLTDALIDAARSEGWKVIPRCSYVVTAFRRHPEWGDVLAS